MSLTSAHILQINGLAADQDVVYRTEPRRHLQSLTCKHVNLISLPIFRAVRPGLLPLV